MSAWWSTCAASMNGCPAKANPKPEAVDLNSSCPGLTRASNKRSISPKMMDCRVKPGNDGTWIGVSRSSCRFSSPAAASLAAQHVQAGIEELQGGVADRRVDFAAVDAGSVDAGLRKFISAVIVTFIDEDVVIDAAGNDVKLGVGDVSRGELGVVL